MKWHFRLKKKRFFKSLNQIDSKSSYDVEDFLSGR